MFVEDVTSGADEDGYDLQQFRAAGLGGRTVSEIRQELDAIDGPLLVAVARKEAAEHKLLNNPPRTLKIEADDYLIVLSNQQQSERFSEKYQVKQGR